MKKGQTRTGIIIILISIVFTFIFLTPIKSPTGMQTFTPQVVVSYCPITINDSSTLAGNLTSVGNCITIGVNNIQLDCLGFTINGSGFGEGIRLVGRSNVTVKNCVLTNFGFGITLSSSNNNIIQNNTILFSNANAAITLDTSHSNRFIGNNASHGKPPAGGFAGANSQNNTFINNTAYNNTANGFSVHSTGNNYTNNIADSNGARGFRLGTGTDSARLENNIARFNTLDGFFFQSSFHTVINNTAHNNALGGTANFFINFCTNCFFANNTAHSVANVGFQVQTSTGGTYINNTARNHGGNGFFLFSSSNNNAFNNDIAHDNGFGFRFALTSNNNNFSGVSAFNNTVEDISIIASNNNRFDNAFIQTKATWLLTDAGSTGNNLTNTTFDNANGSIRVIPTTTVPAGTTINLANLRIRFNSAFLNSTSLSFLNVSAQITLNNVTPQLLPNSIKVDLQDDGTFETCPASRCTLVSFINNILIFNVTSFTTFTTNDTFPAFINESSSLISNITTNGSAIIFNASNITLDCNGFTLTGNGTGAGISANRTNITIQNCIITNYTTGINLTTNDSFFINNTADNNTEYGFFLNTSSNNTFTNNTASYNTFANINLLDSSNNTFNRTLLKTNTTWLFADPSTDNNLTNTIFERTDGSIRIIPTTNLPNATNISLTNLDITFNRAFLNSTNLSFLNTSGQITLNGLTGSVQAIVDFEDDGTFIACTPPQCVPVSYAGGTFVFNVSSFTTYSTTTGGVNVTISKTDNPDPVTAGNTLNYTITFNITNGTAFNTTITETYPPGVVFVNSTPLPSAGNNVWNAGNLTINQSFQINITVTPTIPGLINNTVNIAFQNSTGDNLSISTSETTNVTPQPAKGGGSAGGAGAAVCPPICQNPEYSGLSQCRNCPQKQAPACIENWLCTEWRECQNSKQTRDCQDANKCGTTQYKPTTQQTCTTKPTAQPEFASKKLPVQTRTAEYPIQSARIIKIEKPNRTEYSAMILAAALTIIILVIVIARKIIGKQPQPKSFQK